ncbi:MAG: 30S ribosomal protein S6 [Candidatus Gottesmanbacteria bacterium]|nr:30S ribosomal protein S6 [Candidatus Gottesmanbacteria bacterium]
MKTYELMLIIRPDLDVTEKKAVELINKLLVKAGGVVSAVSVWGKRTLAFPIKKMNEGIYVLATIEGTLKTADLEKEARMGTDYLRFMLTVK